MELTWMENPENVRRALILLADGMIGIFAVMLVLIGSVALMNWLTRKDKD